MLQSKYFIPVLKNVSSDVSVKSHAFMLKSGMIRQHASGIYNWLPLGLATLRNVEKIIRSNMDKAGFLEILMPCVQNADLWKESERYEAYGSEMLKFRDRHDHDLLFGPTNEEAVTDIIRSNIQSYKQLPMVLYQIQWKFRDEIRPRFGLMRGREFLMKDAYSVDIDDKSAKTTYGKIFKAYLDCFTELGLKVIPLRAENGPIGGNMSHEFHVLADTGESLLYYDKKFEEDGLLIDENIEIDQQIDQLYAATEDIHDPSNCIIPEDQIRSKRGIEVGHIFNFATKYSEKMKALINDKDGKEIPVYMGSYGIGVSRLVAAMIEVFGTDQSMVWPKSVAPFKVSVIALDPSDELSFSMAKNIYNKLLHDNIDVILDDTSERAGSKFATHDLIGSPWQVISGKRSAKEGKIELKNRQTGEISQTTIEAALAIISKDLKQ